MKKRTGLSGICVFSLMSVTQLIETKVRPWKVGLRCKERNWLGSRALLPSVPFPWQAVTAPLGHLPPAPPWRSPLVILPQTRHWRAFVHYSNLFRGRISFLGFIPSAPSRSSTLLPPSLRHSLSSARFSLTFFSSQGSWQLYWESKDSCNLERGKGGWREGLGSPLWAGRRGVPREPGTL